MFNLFKNYLEDKLEENNKERDGKAKVIKQVSQMRFKGNQHQFEHNISVEVIQDKIKLENAGDKETGRRRKKSSQKLIRLSDKWKDVK